MSIVTAVAVFKTIQESATFLADALGKLQEKAKTDKNHELSKVALIAEVKLLELNKEILRLDNIVHDYDMLKAECEYLRQENAALSAHIPSHSTPFEPTPLQLRILLLLADADELEESDIAEATQEHRRIIEKVVNELEHVEMVERSFDTWLTLSTNGTAYLVSNGHIK